MAVVERYNKFSIMKGLAIVGVVIGHLGIETLEIFVNYWHLPVFFFVSGYFLKKKHLENPKKYIMGRFRRLVVPFLIFAIIALFLHNALSDIGVISAQRYSDSDFIDEFKRILLLSSNEELIGAMWFLPALFIVSIIGYLLIKLSNITKSMIYIFEGVMGLFTLLVCIGVPSPYCVWHYASISWIFILGYICACKCLDAKLNKVPIFILCIGIILLALLMKIRFGCQADMISSQSLVYPVIFVAGIAMVNYISHLLVGKSFGKMLAIIGNFSFSIMAFHFAAFKFVTWIRTLFDQDVLLTSFPVSSKDIFIWGPVYIIAGVFIPIMISSSYDRIKNAWRCNCSLQKS